MKIALAQMKMKKYRREVASGETEIYKRREEADRPPHP